MGSFHTHACKGKEWKGVLKEWLNLLRVMRNPKSFYRSQFLKDVLQNRLALLLLLLLLFYHKQAFYYNSLSKYKEG